MKLPRFTLTALVLFACHLCFSQTSRKTSDATVMLSTMKTLAGMWQGSLTTDSQAWATDKVLPLTIRVASHDNALVHELDTGGPEITLFYVEENSLALVHYCDFGNRPHMIARSSETDKVIKFELTEAPGSNQVGHVSQATFTLIDPDHHTEDWIFLPKGQKPVHAHMDFKRVSAAQTRVPR